MGRSCVRAGISFSAAVNSSRVAKPSRAPLDEERGRAQVREVSGAQLRGRFRRMQRIGKQEQRVCERGIGRGEHRGLASAVGMSAEEDAVAGKLALECFDRGAEALLVAFGAAARRRSMRTELAERQIAAKDGDAGFAEGVCQSDEER